MLPAGMPETELKVRALGDVAAALERLRADGKTIVLCHGVFDLLHIGHIKHLKAARRLGDVVVVTVTPDRFVNKGPHRPAFTEQLRAEALAAVEAVDYVAINEWPTAVETIRLLRPHVYVKGVVRDAGPRDHTGAIDAEEGAVREIGGRLELTDEETFSASALINRYLDVYTPEVRRFLEEFRQRHTAEEIIGHIQAIRGQRVLVVGETIVDEYCFCHVMNKANKDPILAARFLCSEQYAGGVLAIANHIAGFCDGVGVLSALGERDSRREFIESKLNSRIRTHFFPKRGSPTIVKRRFLEEYMAVKLFEVYDFNGEPLEPDDEARLGSLLDELLPQYDVVVVADYGHGLLGERAIAQLCRGAKFLAVNTQLNAGNRGFNFVSKYPRADYIVVDEPEARLEVRNQNTDVHELVHIIARRVACGHIMLTQGKKGSLCYSAGAPIARIPAFGIRLVDRVGAGDAVLAITAPCVAQGISLEKAGFIGNVVGAEACGIMGNKSSIDPASLFRHITSLMK
jgi:rfaE bifunctional protein nucleotidyltransferase chain/domain